jgi:hypothetical protein
MRETVHFIPILTTILAALFAADLFRRWRARPNATYLAWWLAGAIVYGLGTLAESITTLAGWQERVFRVWYIAGALLGGALLAQGVVYLLLPRKVADRLALALVAYVGVAAVCVLLTPINAELVEPHRLSGAVMAWQWTRLFSPLVNTYAFLFLVGGAIWSAWQYWRRSSVLGTRVLGNVAIAIGALLPGIGGSSARAGMVEALYVTELIGLLLIWAGYRLMAADRRLSIHAAQVGKA